VNPESGALDNGARDRIPPQGVAAEILAELEAAGSQDEPAFQDFYSMWAAVTALTQEVRLQGRAFKQLSDALDNVGAAGERALEREAARSARKEILDSLLELRDCLDRGMRTFEASRFASRPGRLARWFAPRWLREREESLAALEKGYCLGIERLDETLNRLGVHPILTEEQRFDPETMSVIDVELHPDIAEGTVLEEYRSGWLWDGQVYRVAQVKVVKNLGISPVEEKESHE